VRAAFSVVEAARMRDVIWEALEEAGIHRNNPATWAHERPSHLQRLKGHPVFDAIPNEVTLATIDAVLEGQPWQRPRDWGSFFLIFPNRIRTEWDIASSGWHVDAGAYTEQVSPPCGVKVHAILNDIGPRCGGTNILSGSHRLVHRWFVEHVPARNTPATKLRKSLLQRHPYLRALSTPGSPRARIARFHEQIEELDGIKLQVLENTASAGDVILMHPLLLHAGPASHSGPQPRFLLNTDIRVGP